MGRREGTTRAVGIRRSDDAEANYMAIEDATDLEFDSEATGLLLGPGDGRRLAFFRDPDDVLIVANLCEARTHDDHDGLTWYTLDEAAGLLEDKAKALAGGAWASPSPASAKEGAVAALKAQILASARSKKALPREARETLRRLAEICDRG